MSMLLTKALNLGVIDTALNWLIDAITTLLMWLVNWTIDLVITLFAGILYEIGLTLLSIVDFFQAFFNALCGLGTYWTTESDGKILQHVKEDPLLDLVTNKSILQVLLALGIVALILLIMTTVIAMIRTEYTTEGAKNTKGNIIGTALKSLAMFFLVPAFCVFGIILSNTLLQMVYIATSGGDNVTAGAMVWYASSYNANKVRLYQDFYNEHWGTSASDDDNYSIDFKVQGQGSAEQRETVAGMIDLAFKNGTPINKNSDFIDTGFMSESVLDFINGDDGLRAEKGLYSYRNVGLTKEFYELKEMNFIVMYLGGGIAVYIMFIAAFGLIIRMYKCAVLFMVSAPIQALTPLDGGNAFKNWRKLMIGSVCAAFSVVIAFNLMFLLIPIMGNINIFNPGAGYTVQFWNRLVNMIFVLTGLYSIKETSKWVANMLGIEDPLAAGSEIAGKVMGTVSKVATVAGSAGLAMGANLGKAVANAGSSWARAAGNERLSQRLHNVAQGKDGKGGLAAFQSKMTGVGSGIIGKSMSKQFSRFDDFAGGVGIFGGADGEGIGGLVTKGATKLYGASMNAQGAVLTGIPSVIADTVNRSRERTRVNSARQRLSSNHWQTIISENERWTGRGRESRAHREERMRILNNAREQLSRDQQTVSQYDGARQGNNWFETARKFAGTEVFGRIGAVANYANGRDATSQYWGTINDQRANFTQTQRNAQAYGELIEKNVADALAAANMRGGMSTAAGRHEAEISEAAKTLAKALGIPLTEVLNELARNDGHNLKTMGQRPLQILNEYHTQHDVNLRGFDLASIPFNDSDAEENQRRIDAIQNMLRTQGVAGATITEQLNSSLEKIKEEQRKVAEEIRKEAERMTKEAREIAKAMKKYNPAKK